MVPNRSTTSWARVGRADREIAPFSWTISVAAVQPGSQVGRELQHRAAPRHADRPFRPDRGKVVRGGRGDALAGELLVVGRRAGGRHVDHDGAVEREPLDEGVLEGHEAGGRVDDLDPDGGLAQGTIQQPADLEAAHAEALADLVLGQVEPVVELGRAEHQPGLAGPELVLALDQRAGRHAQMCS